MVNQTDKVYTLTIDGEKLHVFQGDDWNKLTEGDRDIMRNEGAYRYKVINRRGVLREMCWL